MGLEPEVEQRIAGYRRRARMRKAVLLIPIAFIAVFCCFTLLNVMVVHHDIQRINERTYELNKVTGSPVVTRHTTIFLPALLIPLFIWVPLTILFLGTYYYAILQPVMQQYRFTSRDPERYHSHRYHLFADSLEGAAIAAGIPPPKLHVVDMPTANAFTFEAGGRQAIGVTPEMLEANLTQHEVEAVMAHQVAHITTHSGLKAPLALSPKAITLIACLVFLLPIVTAIVVGNEFIGIFPMILAPALPIWTVFVMKPYLPWKRLTYYMAVNGPYGQLKGGSLSGISKAVGPGFDEDLVADSLAAKMTSEPGALKSAITKLKSLMETATTMPTQTITFPFLFIGPLKEWDPTPPAGAAYRLKGFLVPRGEPAPSEELIRSEMDAFIRVQQHLLAERLENLYAIECGHWQQFQEVRGGEVRTSPEGWE